MGDERYNGWTNWETWDAFNWMTADDGAQEMWERRARAADPGEFAEALRLHFEAGVEKIQPEASWFADVMLRAVQRVDWVEIAEHFTEEETP